MKKMFTMLMIAMMGLAFTSCETRRHMEGKYVYFILL